MRSSKASPRRMHLPDYHIIRGSLEDHANVQQAEEIAEVNEVSHDTLRFLEQYCKLKPYWYLLDLIQSMKSSSSMRFVGHAKQEKALILGLCILLMLGITLI